MQHEPLTTDHGRLTASRSSLLLGLAVSVAMAALALHPQVSLWLERGAAWNGEYAQMYSDEPFYAVYANALRAGRPRRNDPYSGRDHAGANRLPESILSIQFLAGYAVALPARLLGLSTATVFILLPPLVACFTSLALYLLVLRLTGDEWVAAAAIPFVLCLGVLVTYQGAIRTLAGTPPIYTYLPFLRRFLPAVAFPVFVCFFLFVLRALDSRPARARRLWSLAAGASFAALVYAYFYLWTAALAWTLCLAPVVLLARRDERRAAFEVFGVTLAAAALALAPYFRMLAARSPDTDAVQALALTHAPDLFRRPELVACLLLAALACAARRGLVDWRGRAAQFAAAFALMPFAVYNQQVLTGRALQPLHYDTYAANYSVLIAAALVAWLFARGRRDPPRVVSASRAAKLLLAGAAVACLAWGLVESKVEADRLAAFNRRRDEARPAMLCVAELTGADARGDDARDLPVVLWTDLSHADELPGVAARASTLWAMHMYSYPGAGLAENKERLFTHLHYTGVSPARFAALAESDLPFRHFLFGWERINRRLNPNWRPVTADETRAEIDSYASFASTFTRERAARLPLSYLVTDANVPPDLSNLARHYDLDAGERAGPYVIHRIKLKGGG